ncbi:MAG: thiamine pyrophosphokinase [Frankiaceae bacterium]|jgi:uncharacterized membrane-anchored protein|nr:thiamine pyrophosphokinase [Frankiaceae bacterium]
MKLGVLRRRPETGPGVSGLARLDRRTSRLAPRLGAGDIAVIDHADIDRASADSLVAARVGAVINAQPSISGRYPNLGPEALVAAGIPLIDGVGSEIFAAIKDGARVRVDGDTVFVRDQPVATGVRQNAETIAEQMTAAKSGLSAQLEAFAASTQDYMRRESGLLLDGAGVPEVRTSFEGRAALIVVRGYDYRADLRALRHYIREFRPVLVGVDGGADALRELGFTPHMIVGDPDSVSDQTLRCGAEIVVRTQPDGSAAGLNRIQDLGLGPVIFPAAGASEDIAMLLADEKGASLIIAVGTHASLVEFLDKGRAGMASTFLTRLRLGAKLVDAKAVLRLYRSRISALSLLLLVAAAFIAIGSALAVSAAGRSYLDLLIADAGRLLSWLRDRL